MTKAVVEYVIPELEFINEYNEFINSSSGIYNNKNLLITN